MELRKLHQFELRELIYFVAVAEELHFARAAERAGINQSPLSKAITVMERNLGVRLFVRTRRSTRLTAIGEILLGHARRILAEVDQARRSLIATASGRKGRLRIALCDGLAHPRIARLLAESRREDPEVDVRIAHCSFHTQIRELLSGILDVALALDASADPEICSVPLWKDAVVVVVRPEHVLATEPTVKSIGTTAGPAILMGERSGASQRAGEKWVRSIDPELEVSEYVSSLELLLTLVASGCGIGLISAAQAETIQRPDLAIRPLSVRGATITTFLLRRNEASSPLIDRFVDRAQEMVS